MGREMGDMGDTLKPDKERALGSQGLPRETGSRRKRLHLSVGAGGRLLSLHPSALASDNPDLLPSYEQGLQSLRKLRLGPASCMFTVQAVTFAHETWCCLGNLYNGLGAGIQARDFGGGGRSPRHGPWPALGPSWHPGFPLIPPTLDTRKLRRGKKSFSEDLNIYNMIML